MCDTFVHVLPDRVLFGKNSDRDPNEGQSLEWVAAREHAAGERVRCTWIDVPQARRTHAVLLSRPFWMWGAEIGANEHGVVAGNEAVFTRDPVPKTGLTGMDLLRLGLERGETAERAIEAMIELLETHGQGGRCGLESAGFRYFSSFLVADAHGAIVLETSGRAWTTERVEAGARSISNGLTIRTFAEQHSDTVKTWACACRARRARTEALAERARDAGDVMAILRDHGEGRAAPRYRWLNGAMDAPCMHAGGLAAASQTTASWVAVLEPAGAAHWVTATAAPCTSIFKPVRVGGPLELGAAPTDVDDGDSLFWRHERLHRRVLRDPRALLASYVAERDAVERAWLAAPPDPADAFREADRLLARWTNAVGAVAAADTRPWYAARYWRRREAWAAARGTSHRLGANGVSIVAR